MEFWKEVRRRVLTQEISMRAADLPPRTVPLFMLGLAYHFFEEILIRQAPSCRVGPEMDRFRGWRTEAQ